MEMNEFRRHAHELVDWMADYLTSIADRPVRPDVRPGEIAERIPARPPEHGEGFEAILADVDRVIMPGMTHWQHPRFFAYFPANSSPPSVLAEMITATLGAQCMSWETSPAATELETTVVEWLRQMLGLPEGLTGCIQDTASTATLCALVAARERASGGRTNQDGLAETGAGAVYCSREAHSSIEKAVRVIGLGSAHLRKIEVDARHGLDAEALAAQMDADREAGIAPVAVVACLGTTGASGFDPLKDIARVCEERDVWLHVDAAWAGSALVLPEYRWMIDGVDRADSFVFNPHKWMFTNFDCSVLFLRDATELVNSLSILPEYLKTSQSDVVNYRDWGLPLGRRFRALKLWFVIRSYGVEGLRKRIAAHIAMAHELAAVIEREPGFDLVMPPVLSLLCFRWTPPGVSDEECDDLNARLLDRINGSGRAYLTHTRIDDRYVIRFVVGQTSTSRRDVLSTWEFVRETAGDLRL